MSDETTDRMAKARAAKAARAEAKTDEAEVKAESESVEDRRARLLRELAAMPPAPTPVNAEPGSIVGEGVNARKVPFTRKWFENNCEMVEFIPGEDGQAQLNGITYAWKKNKKTKIPAPHYAVWEDAQNRLEAAQRLYDPPANLQTQTPGYTSPVYRMGVGLMEPIPDTKEQ